jgi:uncharacterized small protein (DUF1192 family)
MAVISRGRGAAMGFSYGDFLAVGGVELRLIWTSSRDNRRDRRRWRRQGMDIEDLEPRKKTIPPVNLDVMSIEELNDYVRSLEAEIARTKVKIDAKKAHLGAAASLFKSSK